MERLCKFIYAKDRTDRIRTCAILCHIYHHALHSRWFQARDLMLMSHLQDNIHHADPPVQKMNGKVWDLFPEADKVRAMLVSMEILADMFQLDLPTVHSIISKMIINEELMNLALQLAEKLGGLVENNERVFDHKQGSYGGYFRARHRGSVGQDAVQDLQRVLSRGRRLGVAVGLKLVRGAYLQHERGRGTAMDTPQHTDRRWEPKNTPKTTTGTPKTPKGPQKS
ncbi:Eukaryotic translation initiation factor 3 subunit C [Anas platyrhynchos]|uniref:Eukaryotic translation initiation factor 3 subunit C n=1 Tax=Anas platyrhynchos TaxID=8839 RepID=R0KVC4_ANAPL|nr:Eukaryotic translation initiation factor 3 subunit C [Anas platyrhynchos]